MDGMKQRRKTPGSQESLLGDPPVETWNTLFQADIHAMLLIADDDKSNRDLLCNEFINRIHNSGGAVELLGEEVGQAMRNPDGHGIEHFGYVDGRSQPLMLQEDLDRERKQHWNPRIPLGQVLVPCPGGGKPTSFGSYFVFRKLEQNVRGFKKMEKHLAKALGLGSAAADNPERQDELEELAGAMVVGRFENGRPVVLANEAGDLKNKDVPNDFNFAADPNGLRCPFAGHIRKTNPRGESEQKFGEVAIPEIRHLMARRGITYGERTKHPNAKGLLLRRCQRAMSACSLWRIKATFRISLNSPRPLGRITRILLVRRPALIL